MSSPSDDGPDLLLRRGLDAWQRGDLDTLEQVLDPNVTLKARTPGRWDCGDREQVMTLLRQRLDQRSVAAAPAVEVLQLDDTTFLVSGAGGDDRTATVVTVTGSAVTAMRQISVEPPDPEATVAAAAARIGDLQALSAVLDARPDLATARIPGYQGRTLLHIVTDWPGYTPHGPQITTLLIRRGADPDVRGEDGRGETPLHWAASNDDVDVARALLDGGADPEAPDGSIGTPLDNAIGYGCWHVARLLVDRGARVESLWHAAALGRLEQLEMLLSHSPDSEAVNQAFWHACAAAQRRTAQRLLEAGADLNWVPEYAEGTALDAAQGRGTRRSNVVEWLQEQGAGAAAER